MELNTIGLSETRRKGAHLVRLNSGHVIYTKGGGEKSVGGVGFLVNKNIEDRVVEFRGDHSRVASPTIKINTKYYLQVVQVYAPTVDHWLIEHVFRVPTIALFSFPRASAATRGKRNIENSLVVYDVYN